MAFTLSPAPPHFIFFETRSCYVAQLTSNFKWSCLYLSLLSAEVIDCITWPQHFWSYSACQCYPLECSKRDMFFIHTQMNFTFGMWPEGLRMPKAFLRAVDRWLGTRQATKLDCSNALQSPERTGLTITTIRSQFSQAWCSFCKN